MNSRSQGSSSGWLCSATAAPQALAVSRIRCRAWPACTQSAGRSAAVVSSPATPAARYDLAGLSGGSPQPCPRAKSRPGKSGSVCSGRAG
jgi:hypothetical protein